MRAKWPYVVAICCLVIVGIVFYFCLWNPTTTILLVRHAERADDSDNTNLSQAGRDRADVLVEVIDEAAVSAIYSTDFCRTAQTAQPSAIALGLTLNVQQSGHPNAGLDECEPSIDIATNNLPGAISTPQDLASHLLSQHAGSVVLVVGHSDTVPAIIEALGQGSFAPIQIDDYDNVFVVAVRKYFGVPRLVKAKYGG